MTVFKNYDQDTCDRLFILFTMFTSCRAYTICTACMMYIICEIERTFGVTTEYFRSLFIYSLKPENRRKLH